MCIRNNIKTLLLNSPEARESNRHLISMYRYHFDDTPSESTIEREARHLKRVYMELRDSNWANRQKSSRKYADKYRSQEIDMKIYDEYGDIKIYHIDNRPFWKRILGIN